MNNENNPKAQLDIIKGNISSMGWSEPAFYYYDVLSKLHLLLVKNDLRQAYFDEVTLIHSKYFENCPTEQIDEIIIEHVKSYEPRIRAINRLHETAKRMNLNSQIILQIPIDIDANTTVPEKIVKEFSTSYSAGKQILIYRDSKIKSSLKQLTSGKQRLGDLLNYPSCCVNWMVKTKTKSLEDCYNFAKENLGDHPDDLIEFLLTNFESDRIPDNEERMDDIIENHVMKTVSTYPFVFHQACTSCLKDNNSSTAKLNKTYRNFAKEISEKFYQKILDESIKLIEHGMKQHNKQCEHHGCQ